jgi:hypothetical protein
VNGSVPPAAAAATEPDVRVADIFPSPSEDLVINCSSSRSHRRSVLLSPQAHHRGTTKQPAVQPAGRCQAASPSRNPGRPDGQRPARSQFSPGAQPNLNSRLLARSMARKGRSTSSGARLSDHVVDRQPFTAARAAGAS